METQPVSLVFAKCQSRFVCVKLLLAAGLALMTAAPLTAVATDYDKQVTEAHLFMEPLVWIGTQPPRDIESQELLGDIGIFKSDGTQAGFKALEYFVTEHPHSAWTPALKVNMAEYYRRVGRYSQALSHWQSAWDATKLSKDVAGQSIAVQAFSGWTRLLASLGHERELESLYKELDALHLRLGSYSTTIEETKEGMEVMKGKPGISYRCGSYALAHLAMQLQCSQQVISNLFAIDSPNGGFTMSELLALAKTNGLAVEAVRRPAGASIVVPCVVHWKLNHYAAITEEKNGRYLVKDPTFEGQVWMDATTINAESSGDFILPKDKMPASWKKLTALACAKIYGKGYPNGIKDGNDTPQCPCPPCGDNDDSNNNPPTSNDGAGGGGKNPPNKPPSHCGMPQWSVHEPYINLWLTDTPLRYHRSDGSWVALTLTYKSRGEAHDPSFSGFGDNWSCNWLGIIQQQSGSSGWVNWVPGGGVLPIIDIARKDYKTGYSLYTNCVTLQLSGGGGGGGGGQIWKYVTTCTVMQGPFLSQNIYNSVATDAAGDTDTLLNYRVDRYGRILEQYNYLTNNGVVQIVNMVDLDGRTNTLFYGDANHPWLITAVTNAYGQSAHFNYDFSQNQNGLLTNIVDAQGMSNYFQYDGSEEITNMITLYGTNSFRYFDGVDTNDQNALARSLLITEPTGDHQLYAYRDDAPDSIPFDSYPNYRLSFHWNRRQYQTISSAGQTNILAMTQADYQNGSVKQWLHEDETSGSLEVSDTMDEMANAYDPVLRTRTGVVTFTYQGEAYPYISDGNADALQRVTQIQAVSRGSYGLPSAIQIGRNSLGRPTNYTYCDSITLGPVASYTNFFDASGTILQYELGPNGELTRGYGYDPVITNLLTSVTNAVGDELSYTHAPGTLKVTSISFPGGLVRTNIYYTNGPEQGFLEMQADEGIRTNWFSWQDGNLLAQTNELGLVTTYTYDNLNRLTGTTYPDGTTTSNIYNNLDIVATKDRLNQWTHYEYNDVRQLIAVTNADNQVTTYDYCGCGSPDEITRWNGVTPLVTLLNYNMGGLLTNIVYPDQYQVNYTYDYADQLEYISDGDGHQLYLAWYLYGLQSQLESASLGGQTLLSQQFDQYDRVVSSIDRNGVTVTNGYDFLGRLLARQSFGNDWTPSGLESFVYNPLGLTNYTDALGHLTTFVRDDAGRVTAETNANQEVLQFTYNPADELLTLTDGKLQTTTWGYDQYGRVSNKVDNASITDFVYQYDADNRLTNRWTPAKGTTVYRYDPLGNLTNVDYSGGTSYTSPISFAYDGLNRLTNMLDGLGDTAFTWTPGDQLAGENGPWDDDAVTYTYDPESRQRTDMNIAAPNASPWTQGYGYDSIMRLSGVTSPAGSFTYYYTSAASDLASQLSLPNAQGQGDAYIHSIFDGLARMSNTTLHTPYGVNLYRDYAYDAGSEVTQQVFTAGNLINYTYDNIGQLTGAQGFESGGVTPRLQEQFGYAYDAAWNLNTRTNNALVQSYTVTNVNELTQVHRSGTLTVAGTATEPSGNVPPYPYPGVTSVTVNGQAANLYADGSFAATNFTLVAGTNTFTAIAQDNIGRMDTNTVSVFLPLNDNMDFDLNGNMLRDRSVAGGTNRNFAYDDENQLTAVWVANSWSNSFVYDGLLRKRIERQYTYLPTSNSYLLTNEIRYIYDGYLVVQERDANNLPQVTYTRGNDLSGSLQGAGGIGGLLARTENPLTLDASTQPQATAYYFNDAQGNVVGMVNWYGALVAQYQYDPFGNLLVKSGPLADANRYRFSSKEWNDAAGLYYYGFRFYDPNLQRWPNRDPLSDWGSLAYLGPLLDGGASSGNNGTLSHDEFVGLMAQINLNVYGAMYNDPINFADPNGNCELALGARSLAGLGISESLRDAALGGVGGLAMGPAVALLGYDAQAFINGLPAQTTFYNPQGNYVNAPPSSLVLASSFNPRVLAWS